MNNRTILFPSCVQDVATGTMMDYDLEKEKHAKHKKGDDDDSKEFHVKSPFLSNNKDSSTSRFAILTAINLGVLCATIYFYMQSRQAIDMNNSTLYPGSSHGYTAPNPDAESTHLSSSSHGTMPSPLIDEIHNQIELPPCEDAVWCQVAMPKVSYFHFEPPADAYKWRIAQIQAAKGEQVLLREVVKVFPSHFDYLDGDITFRKLHLAMDMFVDEKRDFSPLTSATKKKSVVADAAEEDPSSPENTEVSDTKNPFDAATSQGRRRLQNVPITSPKVVGGVLKYPWELEKKRVVPDPYDFRAVNRAPVISLGYTAYKRDSQTYFSGDRIGGAFIDRKTLYKHWRKVKDRIDTPFIVVCSLNENWGFLSTKFPNRTAGWGQCCNSQSDQILYDFLNHEKTLMLVTNQHTNVTHPKIMILPRGIPSTWGQTRILVWDMQRIALEKNQKQKLLFAAGSKWGPRPQILACISKKFSKEDFDGHVDNPPQTRYDRGQYYVKLASTRFGLGLPGLGYDTFR
jgi:hypothetical protein